MAILQVQGKVSSPPLPQSTKFRHPLLSTKMLPVSPQFTIPNKEMDALH